MGIACNENKNDNIIMPKINRNQTMVNDKDNKISDDFFKSQNMHNHINKNIFKSKSNNFGNKNLDSKENNEKYNNIDFDTICEKHESDLKKLYNLNEDEYNNFQEYYYLVNQNWIENCKKKNTLLEVNLKLGLSNEISYPIDFQIINQKLISKYITENSNLKLEKYLILIIKGYLIINNKGKKTNNNIFYICKLKHNSNIYNVDFIFSFFKKEENDIYYNFIKKIILEEKRYKTKEKNKPIYFYDEENSKKGFYICYPFYLPIKINKINLSYYDLNIIYEKFIKSINNITKLSTEEIESNRPIGNISKKIYPIFILRERHFDDILKEIYFNEYNEYKNKNEVISQNTNLNNNINNNNLITSLNDIEFSSQECCLEKRICFINEEFCTAVKINLKNKEKNNYILFINDNYYLYFKKEKKILKINKINYNHCNYKTNNYWKIDSEQNDEIKININDLDKKINELNNNSKNENIKILINLYFNDIFFKNKMNSKDSNSYIEKIKLINKEWLNKYKKIYNYQEIINSIKSHIHISEININDINTISENILQVLESYIPKMPAYSKFPDNYKKEDKLLPQISNDPLFNYPTNFEFIKSELFELLIKELDLNNRYTKDIDNELNNFYDCLFGNNFIILNNSKNPTDLLIYSINNNNDNNSKYFEIKYIFQFMNSSIAQNEINVLISIKNLDNYLINKNLEITKYGKQNFSIGNFYNFFEEEKGILLYKKPTLIGLGNIGATCYMNATLQCLSNIDSLTHFFLIYENLFYKDSIKYDMTIEYAKVIKNLWDDNNMKKYYEPYDFKNKIGEKNPLFRGIAANDSKDLILFIFQELHNELNCPNKNIINDLTKLNNFNNQIQDQTNEKNEYEKFKIDYYSHNNSIIQNIFYGEQESFSHCHNCQVNVFNFNIFSFLIFPLEKVRQYLINKNPNGFYQVTLKDCFDHYILEEIMSGENQMYCNYCHQNSVYSMSNKIYKHPEVMVIILNRGKGLEFDVEFEYPKIIAINNYINFKNNPNYKNNENIEYELISVITHLGESSMSGHFIAYCKSPIDNNWYLYNDASVTENNTFLNNMDNGNLKSIPYVLFYQIKNRKLIKNPIFYINNPTLTSSISVNKNYNMNNGKKSENKEIILYFDFPNGKELYIEIDENTIFKDVISFLIKEYKLETKDYKCYKLNNSIIDSKKSIKDNLINNEEHIKIIY